MPGGVSRDKKSPDKSAASMQNGKLVGRLEILAVKQKTGSSFPGTRPRRYTSSSHDPCTQPAVQATSPMRSFIVPPRFYILLRWRVELANPPSASELSQTEQTSMLNHRRCTQRNPQPSQYFFGMVVPDFRYDFKCEIRSQGQKGISGEKLKQRICGYYRWFRGERN